MACHLLLSMGGISMGGFKITQAQAPPGWDTLILAGSGCHSSKRISMRSTPVPRYSAGCPSSPNLLSSQQTQRCHHQEMRQFRAPRTGAYLPGFAKELFLCFPLRLGRDLRHPPACWVSVTCPRWVTGTRADALATPPVPGDSSPRSCSGRCQGTAGACALWTGPAPCPSGAPRTGGLQDTHVSPHHHPVCSSSAGGVFGGFFGLTRVSVEAPGGQLERGVVAAPAGLVGVVAAALHGELVQPGAVGPLVPDGGERSPHGAGVCHHLQATPASRGQHWHQAGPGVRNDRFTPTTGMATLWDGEIQGGSSQPENSPPR